MSAERGSRRPKQEEAAISALLSEPTIEAAATRAGIGGSTLRRWLTEPEFKARYRAARRQVVGRCRPCGGSWMSNEACEAKH